MGYFGKLEEKLRAQELRRRGWSYGKIIQKVSVSKDTISRWCKDIKLTEKQKKRLIKNKILGQRKGSLVAAENKRNLRIAKTQEIFRQAQKDIKRMSKRDRLIAGIMLYAAEGDKADGRGGFANSDPKLIKFMNSWFREFLEMPAKKLRGAIWLHEGLSERTAKTFWSRLTTIPPNQFHKTYIAKVKNNSRKIRKNIHRYGVFSLRFSDVQKQRTIMGWISAVTNAKIS